MIILLCKEVWQENCTENYIKVQYKNNERQQKLKKMKRKKKKYKQEDKMTNNNKRIYRQEQQKLLRYETANQKIVYLTKDINRTYNPERNKYLI